ncbi:hypothetical protein O6H91_01G138000 [Diphasiastrum complanatum]|uniref:Uncharacterized protein n=1 Tax=Diphasiastrum complanatum TaxID=34168 RepID=A0ACC2EWL4_DIPCM|nr:hypothetical protein O6H91_01G138000 [Diphasiastrum complanatum]
MGIKERAMQRIISGDENKFQDALATEMDKHNAIHFKGKSVAENFGVPSSSNDGSKEVRHPLVDVSRDANNLNLHHDDEFWCNPLNIKAVDDAFEKYYKSRLVSPPSLTSTHVSVEHTFLNLSNCHITFNVSDASVATGILKDLSRFRQLW